MFPTNPVNQQREVAKLPPQVSFGKMKKRKDECHKKTIDNDHYDSSQEACFEYPPRCHEVPCEEGYVRETHTKVRSVTVFVAVKIFFRKQKWNPGNQQYNS
jgi:hypothetical protein